MLWLCGWSKFSDEAKTVLEKRLAKQLLLTVKGG
jgi:hypothetical protein